MSDVNSLIVICFYRILNGANLGGELGDSLGTFSSIRKMYVNLSLPPSPHSLSPLNGHILWVTYWQRINGWMDVTIHS